MRIGLAAALKRSDEGDLRAGMVLAGRSIIAWQADLLRNWGAERVICLVEGAPAPPSVLALQHALEKDGCEFHTLTGFAALPALVRAEDDLIIIRDGLLPDRAVTDAVFGSRDALRRCVATIATNHPLSATHPNDFERIDATRHWAGVLAMRGAAVQQLADFPADSDAVSLLLRLALQAGTPCHDLDPRELTSDNWMLADTAAIVERHEVELLARAAPQADFRAPTSGLAGKVAIRLVRRSPERAKALAGGVGLASLLAGVMAAAFGFPAPGLALAALGAFGVQVSIDYAGLVSRLHGQPPEAQAPSAIGATVDGLAGLALFLALEAGPLGVLGPLTIGLARLAARQPATPVSIAAADRATILLVLCAAAAFGLLPEVLSCLALGLLAALLLRSAPD